MYLGNAGDYQCNVLEGVQSAWGMPRECMGVGTVGNAGECRGMPEEHMGQVNVWEWVQSAREMEGKNAVSCRGMPRNILKWVQSASGMQGNARECKEMQGECIRVGAKCQ